MDSKSETLSIYQNVEYESLCVYIYIFPNLLLSLVRVYL